MYITIIALICPIAQEGLMKSLQLYTNKYKDFLKQLGCNNYCLVNSDLWHSESSTDHQKGLAIACKYSPWNN